MTQNIKLQAFSCEAKVQEIARMIIRISDEVHHVLRRLSSEIISNGSLTSYALLTEEYALRSRANILINDAKRFVTVDLDILHDELMALLRKIENQLKTVNEFDILYERLIALMLFANSIVSNNKRVILFLYDELNLVEKN